MAAIENPHLCWKCRALLNSQQTDDVIYQPLDPSSFSPNTQSRELKTKEYLETTAQAGCPLCRRFVHSMNERMLEALRTIDDDAIEYTHSLDLTEGKPGFLSVSARSEKIEKKLEGDEINCFIELRLNTEVEEFSNHTDVEPSTDTSLTWSLVENWIGACNTLHGRCAAIPKNEGYIPSRVIDITPGREPRLLIGGASMGVTRFTSLSHCWGTSMPVKLQLANLDTLQKGIPYSTLGKTYQDAITISRRLGINYIWIDSLCIIQDSELDWQEQSAELGLVYTNAYCNIAAAHAREGSSGCFVNRDPALVKPLVVELNWGGYPGLYSAIQANYERDNLLSAPLLMRAWVFQERQLARRNLYFCGTEVFFQCHEMVASEAFPNQLPPQLSRRLGGIYPQREGAGLRKWRQLEPETALHAYSLWDWLVQDYSSASLTFPTDKLIAISAIASEMEQYIQSEYYAGIWKRYLPYQLLWEVGGIQWLSYPGRPNKYIAPSWSWASTTGCVESACGVHFSDERDIILKVLDVHVELENDVNPFGQVKSGYLKVEGHLAKGSFHPDYRTAKADIHLQFGETYNTRVLVDDEDDQKFAGKEVYFLPIQYLPDRNAAVGQNGELHPEISGIILRQVCLNKKEYARIGKFSSYEARSFLSAYSPIEIEADTGELGREEWGETEVLTIL